jgi:hypothetical protein
MSHPEIDLMVTMERRKDDLRAAEQSRLIHLATSRLEDDRRPVARKTFSWTVFFNPLVRIVGRFMYEFGVRISSWGCRLQVHYANLGDNQPAPCD